MTTPQIFISYSWASKQIADKFFQDLTFMGLDVIKDDQSIKYTDSITDFMTRIRDSNFALLLICDSYLKSTNCMTEIMQLRKDNNIWIKILPVVFKDAKIYDLIDRIHYVAYWQDKSPSVESMLKNIDPMNATSLYQELKNYKEIAQNIDEFLTTLKDKLNESPDGLIDKHYTPIVERIGSQPDFSKMAELMAISTIADPKIKLNILKEYIQKNQIYNSYVYSILASCHRDLGNFSEAIELYKKATILDSLDYTSWNNLGQIYEHRFENYSEAKKAYEKAVVSKPNFDIPRLNLGLLLSKAFKDFQGAINQYEEILKFDENNSKAHNNLANIYRNGEYKNNDKFEAHVIIAVNQDNIEAIINYGNYLKVEKKEIDLGNWYYRRAKELDTNNVYTEIIDLLMKSTKG